MRWIVTLVLALATAAPAAAEIEVPDFEKEIAKKAREAGKLERQDPAAAEVAQQELEQLRQDAAAELARFGERALDEEHDLALAERLLQRGQDIADLDALLQLAVRIVDIREDVRVRHTSGKHTYERLCASADTARDDEAWFALFDEYRDLVHWYRVDRTIKKVHDGVCERVYPLLVARGDADMEAGDCRQAIQRYEVAAEIDPGDDGLRTRLRTSTDCLRDDELKTEALALLEDASRAHANGRDLEALQMVDRARSLSFSHEPTRAALDEAFDLYRVPVGDRLVARGDEYAGYGYHAQAYMEYVLAAAVSDRVDVARRLDDALSRSREHVHYQVAIAPSSQGAVTGWGDIAGAFSAALGQRMEDSLDDPQYHASVTSDGHEGADAAVTGEYRAFDVALEFSSETRGGAEVTRCKAQLDASLEIQIHQHSTGLSSSQLLTYSNSYEGFCADEPVEGEDAIPGDDACIDELVGGLADQARDAIVGHVHTHGDRWKAHFEQLHPNEQTAHGVEDIARLLLSEPAYSEAEADWAVQELLRRTGLRWEDQSVDFQAIRPLLN